MPSKSKSTVTQITRDLSTLNEKTRAKVNEKLVEVFRVALNDGRVSPWVASRVCIRDADVQIALYDATIARNIKLVTADIDAFVRDSKRQRVLHSVERRYASRESALEFATDESRKTARDETRDLRVRSDAAIARDKSANFDSDGVPADAVDAA